MQSCKLRASRHPTGSTECLPQLCLLPRSTVCIFGERLAAAVSASSLIQRARHSLTSATYLQLGLSTRIVTVRGGRTAAHTRPVLSIALDPRVSSYGLRFVEKLPKHFSSRFSLLGRAVLPTLVCTRVFSARWLSVSLQSVSC